MENKYDNNTFTCSICTDDRINISEIFIVTNECGHEMCRTCAKKHINMKKDDNRHATCPFDKCNKLIPHKKLKEILSDDEFSKYTNAIFYNYDLQQIHNENEHIVQCLTPNCKYAACLPNHDYYFDCASCHRKYCMECKIDITGQQHICGVVDINEFLMEPNQGNDENSQTESDEESDEVTIEDVANQLNHDYNYANCPYCRHCIEKIEGCNHITCKCGNHFCYLCNEPVDPKNLDRHFSEDHPMF